MTPETRAAVERLERDVLAVETPHIPWVTDVRRRQHGRDIRTVLDALDAMRPVVEAAERLYDAPLTAVRHREVVAARSKLRAAVATYRAKTGGCAGVEPSEDRRTTT